ncbi:restriction endonuclease subunit R [Paraclostridium bifermentans]|uniref:type I restriction endonuclease subunit R n=1 Tax=Paraclostridium bifermentans TaxID=1490 RepID=UPI001F31E185|nr:type I restriction endonuclease subunit R [Paraclostridium bifermentans]MCE9674696.1 type I restriction endonuclease subunit R [Paraclostridium bifermentans]GKZ03740.1 restriction endonuclease subunit R [Paraclostridium bifermentans]GKZ07615.1 restriction endonuclease subunit R [Paraclostridium bifermentans]GKZ09969.1 restriction endonuclease subunit R [Paraclostridium bifermentans]
MNEELKFDEETLELATLEILEGLGYEHIKGPDISPGGEHPERESYSDVILQDRVKNALFKINKHLPQEALDEAYRQIIAFNSPSLEENNKHFHNLMVNGIDVSFKENGEDRTKKAYIMDFENIKNNDFIAVNQFTVIEEENKRPDIVIFVNGIPLVVVELKSASDENVGIDEAYNQIQTYKKTIPSLFNYNAFCVLSDGINAKVGTLTSNIERYMNWRTIDGENIAPLEYPQYEVLFKGMFIKKNLLDIIKNFILFQEASVEEKDAEGNKIGDKKITIKILAAYHQYFAVKKAIEKTKIATTDNGDRKIGVVWHTQGSGKSFSMVFYTGALIKEFNNPTVLVVTDRNDLDDQLYQTFAKSTSLLGEEPKHADVRKSNENDDKNGLFDLLNGRESGGIIFTTIQKFKPEDGEMPVLTDRKNVIVMADEAHRSQYGLEAETTKDGEIKYGYAKYLRDALPNASYIGFTGTPIEFDDKSTPAVFGEYIDIYDMTRAVEDKATVKIYYENRIIKLETDEEELVKIDEEFEELAEGYEEEQKEKMKGKFSRMEAIVGSPNRVKQLAQDIVSHYEEKSKSVKGKAMVVCMSRKICAKLYDEIVALRPDWHSDDVNKGKIKVVITGSSSDDEDLQKHIGGKQRRDILAKRMKDNKDELEIVIVRDMWLTGFDVPSIHTMYIDKPMKGHNLMQAIARVNRVFKDKSGGVVVDYIGILESLKKALKQYTDSDRGNTGIDTSQAVAVMIEKLEILREIMYGFDYSKYMSNSPKERINAVVGGMNFILGLEQDEQKEFKQTCIELAKAHSLCAATDEGKKLNVEVSYFKAVKASLMKLTTKGTVKKSKKEIESRVNQMLEKSIISEEVVDVFDALDLKQPEVSILSEEFLAEVKGITHKNLAVEMLKKLLEGNLKLMEKKNLVKAEKFSEKLQKSLNKYRNQAITNVEVMEELIRMANELRDMANEENNLGLSEDEIAFYYALTDDAMVKELMNDETLIKIAQELTQAIRVNVTIDFNVRKSSQAGMRRIIKRLLRKYDYPPESARKALETVMKQTELMCENEANRIAERKESKSENNYTTMVAESSEGYLI